jgi:aspartate aminotransferase
MKLANRLSVIEPSMTLKVSAKANELKAQGIDVISFSQGEPDFDTPAHIKEAGKKAIDGGATKYTAVEGTPQLRKAVAAWFSRAHGFDVSPKEVMVSAGAKQVIYNAFQALLDEGDEVILPAPYWVSYSEIAKLAGAKGVPVVSRPEDNFIINPDNVAKAITPRTKMLLIVSPCNPTGAVYDEKTLRALADIAVKNDLWILTDDIYRTLIYGDAKFTSVTTFGPEVRKRTIIADGVSKAYSMTGWRIGFGLAPPNVIEAMGTLQGQSTTNAAAPSQAAALAAIEGPTDELEKMRQEFDKRRKYMVQALRAMPGVKCVEPKGAFYAFPDVSAFNGKKTPKGAVIESDLTLCDYLIEEARVAVVPGSAFYAPGFVRLSYSTSQANIEKGLARLGEALGNLK